MERVQVMFTPTICKVRCSQERCVNYCERGNMTTLYSGGGSSVEGGGGGGGGRRRDGSHGPGFRVCEFFNQPVSSGAEEFSSQRCYVEMFWWKT